MSDIPVAQPGFGDLGLSARVLSALDAVGYEVPTPIQAQTIPPLLEGRDLLGQAQTGTGKTAAFALPLLSRLDFSGKATQVLVLTPTRELAIQVSEAFRRYASGIEDFHVAPIYGGQDMGTQLRKLKRGVHIVVGTPGRVMDHMRRGTLKLDRLRCLVLDEADEMLRMGFIEDIEWILEEVPDETQIALFSATLPAPIRRIAHRHLENPVEITIAQTGTAVAGIRQRYWMVDGMHKIGALTRILEGEEFDGILIFVQTKTMTVDLATKLEAQGFAAAPLNGDITQAKREETVNRLKSGKLDIVVATDVAARGLDIDRLSHVINYDVPHNVESYVHRIGRTGRAGRQGDAILFVAPRERWFLTALRKSVGAKIEKIELPTARMLYDLRIEKFKKGITEALGDDEMPGYRKIVEEFVETSGVTAVDVAAALALLANAGKSLLVEPKTEAPEKRKSRPERDFGDERDDRGREGRGRGARGREDRGIDRRERAAQRAERGERKERGDRPTRLPRRAAMTSAKESAAEPVSSAAGPAAAVRIGRSRKEREGETIRMLTYRIEVGRRDGVHTGEVAGVLSREAGLDRKYVGRIELGEESSTVELPEGMPSQLYQALKRVRIAGKFSNLTLEKPPHRQKS